MKTIKVLTRDNEPTDELQRSVKKTFNDFKLEYTEAYYMDYDVDEDTGMINRQNKVEYFTKSQMDRNLKALKTSYLVALCYIRLLFSSSFNSGFYYSV